MTVTKAKHLLGGEYPTNWAGFIGQDLAKDQLITAARAAKKRKVPMEHTLIQGGKAGIGKTSLAILAAAEMGAGVVVTSGKMKIGDARMVFSEMQDGDVLIIDEFHQMVTGNKTDAEWLLHYLQDGVLVTPLGAEVQPKVTIIAVSTNMGAVQTTILGRFTKQPLLVDYTGEQAAKIAQTMATRMFTAENLPVPSPSNCREIAAASSFNPRVMRQILSNLRDISLVKAAPTGRQYDLSLALTWLGLTGDGLTDMCRRYLVVLLSDFGGDGAGAAAMQDRLQEPGGLAYTETLLMDHGMIRKSKAGRVLTTVGLKRARQLAAELEAVA